MSQEYDFYLQEHTANVKSAFEWLQWNMPQLFTNHRNIDWRNIAEHDISKTNADEYRAYDAYFYGNKSTQVVKDFKKAWLLHIHRNPHHWQHWVLNCDEPNEGEICLDMPYQYIIEMICDWWSFSFATGDLSEIFDWYDEHQDYIKMSSETRETVEDILWALRERLGYNVMAHHGIKGQKWGIRRGPPYPLDETKTNKLKNAIGNSILVAKKSTLTGHPNSITQIVNKNGGIDRNYYDESGRQTKQISNNDHGFSSTHNYGEHGEHAHDYIYDDDGRLIDRPTRELNEKERKENGDIL